MGYEDETSSAVAEPGIEPGATEPVDSFLLDIDRV